RPPPRVTPRGAAPRAAGARRGGGPARPFGRGGGPRRGRARAPPPPRSGRRQGRAPPASPRTRSRSRRCRRVRPAVPAHLPRSDLLTTAPDAAPRRAASACGLRRRRWTMRHVAFTLDRVPDLAGRTTVITGANGGLGLQ